MYSIEYLFQECNIKNRTLEIELNSPVLLEDEPTSDIILLKIKCDDEAQEHFLTALNNGIKTTKGIYSVLISDKTGNPLNPITISLNLSNIKEIWGR